MKQLCTDRHTPASLSLPVTPVTVGITLVRVGLAVSVVVPF